MRRFPKSLGLGLSHRCLFLIPFLKVNIACPTFLKGTTVAQTNSLCYRHIERYSIRNGIRSSSRKNMKIQCIKAYQVDLPLYEGSYNWSGGKSVSVFDSTIVSVETDEGVTGYGEVCPLGPFLSPCLCDRRTHRYC